MTASLLDRCHGLLDISYQLRIVKNAWCSSADGGHNMEKDRGTCCLTFRVYQYMSAYLSIYQYIIYIYVYMYICLFNIYMSYLTGSLADGFSAPHGTWQWPPRRRRTK